MLTIRAPPEMVFDVISAPYLGRAPRALADKFQIWGPRHRHGARGPIHVRCAVTTTLEIVRFQRPERIEFRRVRGPIPHLSESFAVTPSDAASELRWQGQLGIDLCAIGEWWGARVAHTLSHAVEISMHDIAAEAERPRASGSLRSR